MKCMSCLGVVVRLNSFRGFNLAHTLHGVPLTARKLRPCQFQKDLVRPNMPDSLLSLGCRHRLKATQLVLV